MNASTSIPAIVPNAEAARAIKGLKEEKFSLCFQCQKCTNGCPVTSAMDITPHRLLRLLALGQVDPVLKSDTIWICASCETCTTRCPNGIDIAKIMDTLRQECLRRGIDVSKRSVPIFHNAFLSSIKRHGRVHETEMALTYSIKNDGLFGSLKMAGMGLDMFKRGKTKIMPSRVRALRQVKDLFKKAEGKA